jgi:hypothetical protein
VAQGEGPEFKSQSRKKKKRKKRNRERAQSQEDGPGKRTRLMVRGRKESVEGAPATQVWKK